jgi:2,3-bisphosphoglycerate-independent phosphoglycerate mutase
LKRVLLVFIDGVGVGAADPALNAFVAAPPRTITELLDGALVAERSDVLSTSRASLIPLDAQLGVPGLPQSGTGQFSLLTGENGAARFGRHIGPYVPTALREVLQRDSLLRRASQAGLRTAFANAYPEELLAAASIDGAVRPIGPLRAGPPLAAAGAGLLVRHTAALRAGDAVASEITNEGWREHLQRSDLPEISPAAAGANLARIANAHDLTLFAHYNTDHVGHQRNLQLASEALALVDAFIAGVLDVLHSDVMLMVVSDHGNLEDASTGHTRNPALGLLVGKGHEELAKDMNSIVDVAGAVLRY